ncbi:MAG TPA: hypothetical protein VM779_16520 [Thermoanaerobaculia bacterium]|nr:hypothetical protein [Thermoanaerobaculia bacterium]
MTSLEETLWQKVVLTVITRRAGSSAADATAVAAAARRAYGDLATALAPLIGQAGVEALIGRALHLAALEYPTDHAGEEKEAAEAFGQVSLWLERQDPSAATDAAAAMFARFAALLAELIGYPLTTRYLREAWPDGFADKSEGKKA